jgi:ribosomal-protein-alanine N-acetyltransferase
MRMIRVFVSAKLVLASPHGHYHAAPRGASPAPDDIIAATMSTTQVLETSRLTLRRFTLDDASFILNLVNDPAWLEHIGDRNVRSVEDARAYIERGPLAMYESVGYGMYVVTLKGSAEPIGTCGLIRRDGLDDTDIGFAFLPAYRGQGFALESAAAVLDHGSRTLGLRRIIAIVSPANARSIRLLEKIGLVFERPVRLDGDDEEILLYATPAPEAVR